MPTAPSGSEQPRFGALLRRYRLDRGLTQEALAERSGLSARGISDLERGARNAPQRETIRRLSDGLRLSDEDRAAFAATARRCPAAGRQLAPVPFQVVADDPWPKSRPPAPSDRLIGRDTEIAAVVALLRDPGVRLLTLLGPGGIGKTRLAIAVAAALGDAQSRAVAFVPLGAVFAADLVLPTIAQMLDVREVRSRLLEDHLVAALRRHPALLILDTFEQIVDAAPVVARLLAACPSLQVLVTSRTPLQIAGEHRFPVPPLPLPAADAATVAAAVAHADAVRLFVARARAVDRAFALTDDNAAAVAAICRRLDGLPLAIELAAARVAHGPPSVLLSRLERRLPLLTGGPRDAPPRQRTLRDAITWSYNLLDAEEQALFRRLGVFVGGCDLAPAEAVAAQDTHRSADLRDTLESLVAKSLLVRRGRSEDEPRFGMLDTIHEFAWERLQASGEAEATARRHACHFLAFGEQLGPRLTGTQSVAAFDRLTGDLPNLRAALTWAVDHGEFEPLLRFLVATFHFWMTRVDPGEGRRWLEVGLARGQGVAARTRVDALQMASDLASTQGDHGPAIHLANESLALARAERYPLGIATALLRIGQSAEWQGDFPLATRCYEEALPIARKLDDPYWEALFLSNLGDAYLWQDDPARAAPFAEDGLRAWRTLGNEWGIALALGTVAAVASTQGDQARAYKLYAESLDLWLALGYRRGIAGTLAGFAAVAIAQNDVRSAARLLGAARALGDAAGIAHLAHHVGYERTLAAVKRRLGAADFDLAWQTGQAMTVEQAVAEGLALAERH